VPLTVGGGALLVLVAFIWGFNFVVISVGLRSFPPFLFSALRFVVCAVPAVFFVPRPSLSARNLIALGIVLGILLFGFLFLGIHAGTPAGLASLIMQTQVFFTLILGAIILGERPRPLNWVALVIGFAGIALIASSRGHVSSLGAAGLVLAGALAWGFSNIMMKRLTQVNMVHLMVWMSLVPPVPLAMASLALDGWPTISASLRGMTWLGGAAILYTGLFSTLFAYGVWGTMLQRHASSLVAPFALLVPVFGMGASIVALGERHGLVDVVASVLVLLALALNIWAPRLEAAASASVKRSS
jgi:O-acetylserine/cysteine efflux transporter